MKNIESLHDSSSTPIIIDFDKQLSILNSQLDFKLQLDSTIQVLKSLKLKKLILSTKKAKIKTMNPKQSCGRLRLNQTENTDNVYIASN